MTLNFSAGETTPAHSKKHPDSNTHSAQLTRIGSREYSCSPRFLFALADRLCHEYQPHYFCH